MSRHLFVRALSAVGLYGWKLWRSSTDKECLRIGMTTMQRQLRSNVFIALRFTLGIRAHREERQLIPLDVDISNSASLRIFR